MKLKPLIIIFNLLFVSLNLKANASQLFTLDSSKRQVFLTELRKDDALFKDSQIENIFAPHRLDAEIKIELDKKISGLVKSDFMSIKNEIESKKNASLALWDANTLEKLKSKVSDFLSDTPAYTNEEKSTIIAKLESLYTLRQNEYAQCVAIYHEGRQKYDYPATLWSSYIARLVLDIKTGLDDTSNITGGGVGFFQDLLTPQTRKNIWALMIKTGFVTSGIDIETFRYSPSVCLAQSWNTGRFNSILVGCGRFDRAYIKFVNVLDKLHMSSKSAMNCGCCSSLHTADELTVNFDPVQSPDVIADALNAESWSKLTDNSVPVITDETGHNIFLRNPAILETLRAKLKPSGYIFTRLYDYDRSLNQEHALEIAQKFNFQVETTQEDNGTVAYKFIKKT